MGTQKVHGPDSLSLFEGRRNWQVRKMYIQVCAFYSTPEDEHIINFVSIWQVEMSLVTEPPKSAICASHSPCHPASFRFGIVSLCLWLLGQKAVWRNGNLTLGYLGLAEKWTVGFWGTLSSDTPTWCGTMWVPRWEMNVPNGHLQLLLMPQSHRQVRSMTSAPAISKTFPKAPVRARVIQPHLSK